MLLLNPSPVRSWALGKCNNEETLSDWIIPACPHISFSNIVHNIPQMILTSAELSLWYNVQWPLNSGCSMKSHHKHIPPYAYHHMNTCKSSDLTLHFSPSGQRRDAAWSTDDQEDGDCWREAHCTLQARGGDVFSYHNVYTQRHIKNVKPIHLCQTQWLWWPYFWWIPCEIVWSGYFPWIFKETQKMLKIESEHSFIGFLFFASHVTNSLCEGGR